MNAKGYKITNIKNGMCYYGIVHGKFLDIYRRFNKHMSGKGGKFLYEEGVRNYGAESFVVEQVIEGDIQIVRDWEYRQSLNNLWPVGYNGNAGRAIVMTDKIKLRRLESYKKTINEKTKEQIEAANIKRNNTRNKRTEIEIAITKQKLAAASKKFWETMTVEEKQVFLKKRSKRKSDAFKEMPEDRKDAIRQKIKTAMCKKQYKSPFGIFASTVDGGRAEGISSALFNYRCKSDNYPDYVVLST